MKLISQASSRELRLMVQCLELYYRQSKSQKDIATTLGVSAATVSRLLKRAFDERLVRVELDLARPEGLEGALAHAAATPSPPSPSGPLVTSTNTPPPSFRMRALAPTY